jgi:hypothetical protein
VSDKGFVVAYLPSTSVTELPPVPGVTDRTKINLGAVEVDRAREGPGDINRADGVVNRQPAASALADADTWVGGKLLHPDTCVGGGILGDEGTLLGSGVETRTLWLHTTGHSIRCHRNLSELGYILSRL